MYREFGLEIEQKNHEIIVAHARAIEEHKQRALEEALQHQFQTTGLSFDQFPDLSDESVYALKGFVYSCLSAREPVDAFDRFHFRKPVSAEDASIFPYLASKKRFRVRGWLLKASDGKDDAGNRTGLRRYVVATPEYKLVTDRRGCNTVPGQGYATLPMTSEDVQSEVIIGSVIESLARHNIPWAEPRI